MLPWRSRSVAAVRMICRAGARRSIRAAVIIRDNIVVVGYDDFAEAALDGKAVR